MRGVLAILLLTTKRRTSSATSIRGSSGDSRSTTRELNATPPFGVRWNPSLFRSCLRPEGTSRTRQRWPIGLNHCHQLAVECPLVSSRKRHSARESHRVSRMRSEALPNLQRITTSAHGCVYCFYKHIP